MKKTIYSLIIIAAIAFAVRGQEPNCPIDPNNIAPLLQNAPACDGNHPESPETARQELLEAAGVNEPTLATANSYISGEAFNAGLAELFKEYIDDSGLVNYPKLRRKRLDLNNIVEMFNDLPPEVYLTWSRNNKIAFWLNAYNVCTLKGIIDNYPIKPSRFMLLLYPANSIMHIKGLRDATFFKIMGLQYTLEEIEKEILLGRFEEPRASLAISYGTTGSAPLRNEPYIGKVLDKQLDDQVKKFFSNQDNFSIDNSSKTVNISSIFKMYSWRTELLEKIYGKKKMFREYKPLERSILNFIQNYISQANSELLKRNLYSIKYIKYNWRLNEQPEK